MADSSRLNSEEVSGEVALRRALLLVCALLWGLFIVIRTSAFQLTLYSAETGLAGLIVVLLGLSALGVAWTQESSGRAILPDRLMLACTFLIGIFVAGLIHSPHLGMGLPRAAEMGLYILILLVGNVLGRSAPGMGLLLSSAIVAMGVTESFVGIWQKFVELPRLRRALEAGELALPSALQTQQGLERVQSNQVYATFGNANSFGAFLIVSMMLLLGLWLHQRRVRSKGCNAVPCRVLDLLCLIFLGIQGYALYLSGSKGAWLAGGFGGWLFVSSVWGTRLLGERWIKRVTCVMLAGVILLLGFGYGGWLGVKPFGYSMELRFEYWRTAMQMIREAPVFGIGLGGFGDAFATFKTPMATEVRDAHCDWLQLWAELGIFGPVAWGIFWWVVLRKPAANASEGSNGEAQSNRKVEQPDNDTAGEQQDLDAAKRWFWAVLVGGFLAFLVIYQMFDAFNAEDLRQWLAGQGDSQAGVRSGAILCFLLPQIFAVTYIGLARMPGKREKNNSATGDSVGTETDAEVSGKGSTISDGLQLGMRCAIGVVLVHQLVDFDLKAQAVMASIFLLGGFLVASRREAEAVSGGVPIKNKDASRSRLLWLMLPLVLFLIPGAVVIPLNSGLARQMAERQDSAGQDQWARLAKVKDSGAKKEMLKEVREGLELSVRDREAALAWAPFDGQAASDLGLSYARLEQWGHTKWTPDFADHQTVFLSDLIDSRLEDACRMRPYWHAGRSLWGQVFLVRGMIAQGQDLTDDADQLFEKAADQYKEASKRYPLAPRYLLLQGDAFMLRGNIEKASKLYWKAWLVDRKIIDRNTRLSSIFHDPKPMAQTRHGFEGKVLFGVDAALRTKSKSTDWPGLLVRRMLCLDSLRTEAMRKATGDNERQKAQLNALFLSACQSMAKELPEDVNAALFAYAAISLLEPDAKKKKEQARTQMKALLLKASDDVDIKAIRYVAAEIPWRISIIHRQNNKNNARLKK